MYVVNRRNGARESFSGQGNRVGTVLNHNFTTPSLVEGVYTWRTGQFSSDLAGSPPTRSGGQWGVIAPKEHGNLAERLADRSRYLSEVQRAAFPAETQSGSLSTSRTSGTDSGHVFGSHKTFRTCYTGTLHRNDGPTDWYDGDVWGSVSPGIVNPSPFPLGFSGEVGTNMTGVSQLNRQGMANRYFEQTAPDRKDAGLAVTLIELLRGDVPSLVKNYRKLISGQKRSANALGSEFLNLSFGWTPLLQETANVLKVGMTLERAIYYESFRRKRSWDGPSANGSIADTVSINSSNGPYGSRTYPLPGERAPLSTGFGVTFSQDARWTAAEDYHFSSKYTGLAKASRHAASLSDQAMDVTKRLGLVDDPRLIWDLMPYSWLVDWFSTMGASISNASTYAPRSGKYSTDYAYMTTKNVYTSTGHLLRQSAPAPGNQISIQRPTSFVSCVTKWRDRATPFGFGTQLGSLNATQFGILVALGMAKTR